MPEGRGGLKPPRLKTNHPVRLAPATPPQRGIKTERNYTQMKILFDTHTHTNVSDHAYSTLAENVAIAKQKGMDGFAMTNHGPSLGDAPHVWHFYCMRNNPKVIDGVRVLYGVEANVLDEAGNLDMSEFDLSCCEVVIASIHTPCYVAGRVEKHTNTWLNVIKNPQVDIIGHSGEECFRYDYERVIAAAKAAGKCIEINSHSFKARAGTSVNCRTIAEICKKLSAPIVVASDAHICYNIGKFDNALEMLAEIDFPEELIMNTTAEKFIEYIEGRRV